MPSIPTDPMALEPGCDRCPALVEARECIAWGNGARDARLMVVGEAPGAGEPAAERWQGGNWTGLAYTSHHSGRRVRELIEALGHADDAFYTNAVKCFPAADGAGAPTNREPRAAERAACRGHVRREIEEVDPAVVLTTGRHATETMVEADGRELDGFLDVVLEPLRCEAFGVWVLPLLHPSYQDVWIPRLGYDPDGYLDAIARSLDELLGV